MLVYDSCYLLLTEIFSKYPVDQGLLFTSLSLSASPNTVEACTLGFLNISHQHSSSLRSYGSETLKPAAPTWLQHSNLQQVRGPLCQSCPGVVVVPPPQLCHALILARFCVTGPADAQADIVAGLSLLDGSSGSEGGGPVSPLDPSIPCEGHQIMELNSAHWLEAPRHRHRDPGRVVGLDDALQVEGIAVGHSWCPGNGCDRKACF